MKGVISKIIKIIKEEDDFLITSHIRPDGDAVASELAFVHFLKRLGKTYRIINDEPTPFLYSFLPSSDEILRFSKSLDPPRVAIILDCHEYSRLPKGLESTIKASPSTVVVDHHPGELEIGGLSLLDPSASSTCELLYGIIKSSKIGMDHNMAICLYTGLVADTGGFTYTNTGPRTHMIAAHLLKHNIDVEGIWGLLNRVEGPGFIKLTSLVLATLKVVDDGIAHLTMTKEMEEESGLLGFELESDSILRHIRPLNGIKVCLLFREIGEGEVRVSMRTSSSLDLNKVARMFGGGGHPQAAGCTLYTSLKEAKDIIVSEIRRWLK